MTEARLLFVEQKRPRPDRLAHLLERIDLGFLPAHDEADRGLELRQRLDHQAIGFRQHDAERALVDDRRILHPAEHVLAADVARRPAPHRGNAIGSRHG